MATKNHNSESESDVEPLNIRIRGRGRGISSRTTTPRARSQSRPRDVESDYDSEVESGKKPRKNIASPVSDEPTIKVGKIDSPKKSPVKEDDSSDEESVVRREKKGFTKKKPADSPSSSTKEEKKKKGSTKKKPADSPSSSTKEEKKKKGSTKKKPTLSSDSESTVSRKKKGSTKKKKVVNESDLKDNYTMKFSKRGEPLVLYDIQEKHRERCKEILLKNKFLLDNSEVGSGKTFTAIALIKDFMSGELNPEGYDRPPKYVVYITYSKLVTKVEKVLGRYGLTNTCVLSFEEIRSNKVKERKGKVLPHGLLFRQDDIEEDSDDDSDDGKKKKKKKKATKFEVTEVYKEMVKRGCLLILDEVQALMNKTLQYKACKVLERYIIDRKNPSYVIEMSGTPATKIEQFMNVMYRFGLSDVDTIYTNMFGTYKPTGINNIISMSKIYDREKTIEILAENGISSKGSGLTGKNTKDVAFELYKGVIQDHISHAMPEPKGREGVIKVITNAFCRASDEDYKLISDEVKGLVKSTKFNIKTGKFEQKDKKNLMNAVGRGMKRIETSKTNIFIRKAKETLDANKNSKVVIALNNKLNIRNIADALDDYGVIIIWGKDPETNKVLKGAARQELVDKFNRPTTKYRVLIGVMKIISTGLDLDDKDGRFPRTAFASPNYSLIHTHQFTGRFIRGYDTASSSEVKYVYAETRGAVGENAELKILDIMARNGDNVKSTSKTAVENGTIFPGSYKDEVEEDGKDIPDGPLDISDILNTIEDDSESDEEDIMKVILEEEGGSDSDDDKKKKKKSTTKKSTAKKPTKKPASSPSSSEKKKKKKKKKSSSSNSGFEALSDSASESD